MDLDRLNELGGAMETAPVKGFKGLFYSDSGNGKSHLTFEVADRITPEGKFWLMIDTSDNYSIINQINDGAGPRREWRRLPFTFIEDIENIAEAIAANLPGWGDVATIVLDEISVMAQQDIDRIFIAKNKDELTDTPDWGEYRPGFKRIQRMMGKLMSVTGLNILMVAHEKGPVKDLPKQHADIPIASYKAIKKSLTVVGRVIADAKASPGSPEAVYTREIQIHPTSAYDAKCRLGTDLIKMPVAWFPDLVAGWLESAAEDNSTSEEGDPPIAEEVVTATSEDSADISDTSEDSADLSDSDMPDLDFSDFATND